MLDKLLFSFNIKIKIRSTKYEWIIKELFVFKIKLKVFIKMKE